MEIQLLGESQNIADTHRAIMRLIERLPALGSHNELTCPIIYNTGMDYTRGGGHWRSKVCKHGSFNVTSFEPL
jgi:hypothetical protein